MNKTYRIGRRFRKMQYLSVAINCLIVFGFYFIYRFIFEGIAPRFVGGPLALIYLLLAVVVAKLTLLFSDKYAASVCYTPTRDGLLYTQGKRELLYRWEEFSGAKLEEFRFRGVFPVEFQVNGKPLMLNQNLDGLCELTSEILERIRPYASPDPELVKRAKDMSGVY